MRFSDFQALTFDCYGTLIDWEQGILTELRTWTAPTGLADDAILEAFGDDETEHMQTSVISFGYKHGIPLDVDVVFDCRFLPNPFWVEELRPFSGEDEPVRSYVLGQPESQAFLEKVDELLTSILPAFAREGKSYLTIAMGCTGGRHRSVTLAQELATRLSGHGEPVSVFHRDIDR